MPSPSHPGLPLLVPRQRSDAARNRERVIAAARALVDRHGADAVTMDDVAAAAGVGKGTLFRRFGSRAGLMRELLDADERDLQRAMMFGPPPLGPSADPRQRLLAFGVRRLDFVRRHLDLLCAAERGAGRFGPAAAVLHTHVRLLLVEAGAGVDPDVGADALLALLEAAYVRHQLDDLRRSPADLAAGWAAVAVALSAGPVTAATPGAGCGPGAATPG